MKVAVLGTGNGGQAMAAHLAINGHCVNLYGRDKKIVNTLSLKNEITLCGKINGTGKLNFITNDLQKAVENCEIIMIVTTANAHRDLAIQLSKYLKNEQIVVFNPGRTGGALEFSQALKEQSFTQKTYIAEAQTLIYACRIIETGVVNVIGVKDKVFLSAFPLQDTDFVLNKLANLYSCFIPAKNVLATSLENIGAMLHPSVILFNAAAIERGHKFYFYREMTEVVADFIENLDEERLSLGKAYEIDLISVKDWVSFAYNKIEGNTLYERIQNNPAYYNILAPTTIRCRQLLEDIPTGLVPMVELGKMAGVKMPLCESLIKICSILLKHDFYKEGRTLKKLGLTGLSKNEIIKIVEK